MCFIIANSSLYISKILHLPMEWSTYASMMFDVVYSIRVYSSIDKYDNVLNISAINNCHFVCKENNECE